MLLSAGGLPVPGFDDEAGETRSAVPASGLHANVLALPSLETLAGGERPVFFVGDFAHQGSEGEVRLVAPRLGRLGPRVVAVSGNHDSALLMLRLAGTGVVVLTGRGRLGADGSVDGGPVVEVMGLRVAGAGGPLALGREDVGLGRLHFRTGARLGAVDLIESDPLSGGARAERVVVEERRCDDEDESCRLSD
jgi:hypothetical protein